MLLSTEWDLMSHQRMDKKFHQKLGSQFKAKICWKALLFFDFTDKYMYNVKPISCLTYLMVHASSRSYATQSFLRHQNTAEPSDVQSLSKSLRSRLNSWSMRYKESFSRTSAVWKERLFACSPSISDVGSEVQNYVFCMMERL